MTAGAAEEQDRHARIALARLAEPGLWRLFEAVGAAGAPAVLRALHGGRALPGLSARLRDGMAARAAGYDVANDLEALSVVGCRAVIPGDPEWPTARAWWPRAEAGGQLPAPPLVLFVRGDALLAEVVERSVAVVGARDASTYGEHVARGLGLGLADRGLTVVSGAAYGIDAAAHRGALAARDGRTVAVLASGVDVAYPAGHDRLLSQVVERGVVVSENLPGVRPTRSGFLVRNRLIAAFTQGTVVVEAALRSGSLSTAHRAFELSKPVMAVPGPVTSRSSAGCHELLRSGEAQLVTGAEDVYEVLAPAGEGLTGTRRGEERLRDALPEQVRRVLEAVPVRDGAGAATLAQAAGVPVQTVLQAMPPLEVTGLVARVADGWVLTALGAGR